MTLALTLPLPLDTPNPHQTGLYSDGPSTRSTELRPAPPPSTMVLRPVLSPSAASTDEPQPRSTRLAATALVFSPVGGGAQQPDYTL